MTSVVVMGVSGSGKSTLGVALAERLGVPFEDGDGLHPTANVAKMRGGVPLDDGDRWPWLDAVGAWLAAHPDGVVACSALRRAYRDRLRSSCPDLAVVELDVGPAELGRRLGSRRDHFMPASLLSSQLATLEPLQPDEAGLVVDGSSSPDAVIDAVLAYLARS